MGETTYRGISECSQIYEKNNTPHEKAVFSVMMDNFFNQYVYCKYSY